MELLIPFGKCKSGSLVFIDEVESGLACSCVCICCEMPLSAFFYPKGTRRNHFKHAPKVNSKDKPCDISFKRALFWLCREIILDNTEIKLPSYFINPTIDNTDEVVLITETKTYSYHSDITFNPSNQSEQSELATLHSDSYNIVLVLTFPDDNPSFRATLGCKEAIIEIDISDFREYVEGLKNSYRDSVKQLLLNELSIKKWLYHPKESERITHYLKSKAQRKNLAEKEKYQKDLAQQDFYTEYNPISGISVINYNKSFKQSSKALIDFDHSSIPNQIRWFRCHFCKNLWSNSCDEVPYSVEKVECFKCNQIIHI